MRIGMILDGPIPPDPRVENEARMLAKTGHQVQVLSISADFRQSEQVKDDYRICRVHFPKFILKKLSALINFVPAYYWLLQPKIRTFINKNNIDALHIHDLHMAIPVIKVNRHFNLPLVIDLHENFPAAMLLFKYANTLPNKWFVRPQAWKKKEGKILHFVNKIITVSEHYKQNLLNQYAFLSQDDIFSYPNVPDINELQSYPIDNEILQKKQGFTLFYFGRISKIRGVHTAIKALHYLIPTIPEIRLLLIGPIDKAEKTEFEVLMNQKGLKQHIDYIPWQHIRYLPSYIRMSDLCLSPSLKNAQHETGLGNKNFQYILFEGVLVASDCTPKVQLVQETECGIIFKSGDERDLAEKIKFLYENPDIRHQMGKNGRNAIIRKYNTETMGKNLIQLYKNLSTK